MSAKLRQAAEKYRREYAKRWDISVDKVWIRYEGPRAVVAGSEVTDRGLLVLYPMIMVGPVE